MAVNNPVVQMPALHGDHIMCGSYSFRPANSCQCKPVDAERSESIVNEKNTENTKEEIK